MEGTLKIKIREQEVIKAKLDMEKFDSIKTFNKFKCKNNWIGLLGEIVLNRVFKELKCIYTWVEFIKTGTMMPDFIVGTSDDNVTIDLKTSSKPDIMWLQKTNPHDIYLSAHIDPKKPKVMTLNGWIMSPGNAKKPFCVGKLSMNDMNVFMSLLRYTQCY